jgi:hypothetical protein
MCWNKEVSLNTYLFGIFVLALIAYNNKYTQYKTPEFDSIWIYLFFLSFISIQLAEYFIWTHIRDSYYNGVFSSIAQGIFLVQPILSLMILRDHAVRKWLIFIYCLGMIPYVIYSVQTQRLYSTVSAKGHLVYHFFTMKTPHIFYAWLFFFLFSFFYSRYWPAFLFGFGTFLFMTYHYERDKSVGSMWCWIVNVVMLYYAVRLLLYAPMVF